MLHTTIRLPDWTCSVCRVDNRGWRNKCFNNKRSMCPGTRPPEKNVEDKKAQWNVYLKREWYCELCKYTNCDKDLSCKLCMKSRTVCTPTEHCTVALACDSRGGEVAMKDARYIMNNTGNNVRVSCLVAKLMTTHGITARNAMASFKHNVYSLADELRLGVADVIEKMLACDGDPFFVRAVAESNQDPEAESTPWTDACSAVATQHTTNANNLRIDFTVDGDDDPQNCCIVCLERIDEQDAVSLEPCGEAGVCRGCAYQLLALNMDCPLCGGALSGVGPSETRLVAQRHPLPALDALDTRWLKDSRLSLYVDLDVPQ